MVRPFFKWMVSANVTVAKPIQTKKIAIKRIVTRCRIQAHSSNERTPHSRDEGTTEAAELCDCNLCGSLRGVHFCGIDSRRCAGFRETCRSPVPETWPGGDRFGAHLSGSGRIGRSLLGVRLPGGG